MAQQGGFQMGGSHAGGASINPNNLAMSGFPNNFAGHNSPNSYPNGAFMDDELLEGLASPTDQHGPGMQQGQAQDFGGGMADMNFDQNLYNQHSMPMDQHMNHFSRTPEGNPIHSPFVQTGFATSYRHLSQSTPYPAPLQSPLSYAGSPLAGTDLNEGDGGFMNRKPRARMSHAMQRNGSSHRNTPLGKTAPPAGLAIDASAAYSQPIQTGSSSAHPRDVPQPAWGAHTPNSLTSFPPSSFNSPLAAGLHGAQAAAQINDMLLKGGASMPAKIGAQMVASSTNTLTTQEAKRKRRRESHNLVERRRRDNINERIQDLSKLVPAHRLEDEKIRKAIQNGTPLSPTLGAVSPTQATSGLAGSGMRRATVSGMAGNITTGLPIEEKDKGPNKGDILNGAVAWMRDLMWMLHLKVQQQEELINCLVERGGTVPFEITDDDVRMQSELLEAIARIEESNTAGGPSAQEYSFSYSRTHGSGLRVPHHTDIKGDPLNGSSTSSVGLAPEHAVITPEDDDIDVAVSARDQLDATEFFDYDDDDNAGNFLDLKEEGFVDMDMTQ